ncbi:hypothetical protein P691DRAFT_408185 [Macrolepiota fuliginosa MF-IS2]|uniref:Uncharacterized protein n=1 Tax=Macrolepiota fuliginosa MF-IS2 TaxID=1400762 RepID=A0A9P5X4J1_9AGAR|nr:hypothetical protein P691DRAFT_408185 [Macrolepiota fuliginosa MF-IS2]
MPRSRRSCQFGAMTPSSVLFCALICYWRRTTCPRIIDDPRVSLWDDSRPPHRALFRSVAQYERTTICKITIFKGRN